MMQVPASIMRAGELGGSKNWAPSTAASLSGPRVWGVWYRILMGSFRLVPNRCTGQGRLDNQGISLVTVLKMQLVRGRFSKGWVSVKGPELISSPCSENKANLAVVLPKSRVRIILFCNAYGAFFADYGDFHLSRIAHFGHDSVG